MPKARLMIVCPPPSIPTHWVARQVEAEKAAWQLAEELGLDVVTILPNFVLVSFHTHPCVASRGVQRLLQALF
jgi:predicted RecB family endonuclease